MQRVPGELFVGSPDPSHDQRGGSGTNRYRKQHFLHFPPLETPLKDEEHPFLTFNIMPSAGGARLEGYIGEVALIAGAGGSNPPLCRILWVLSWRRKKVPPPAGSGF